MASEVTLTNETKVYPMDKSVVIILIICSLISYFGAWGITVFRDDQLKYAALKHTSFWDSSTVFIIGLFGLLSCAAAFWAIHTFRILFSKIIMTPSGIERAEAIGGNVFIPWKDLGHLSEMRRMQRLVVLDTAGKKRILVDYQFINFMEIQNRVFEEFQKTLILPAFPIHFGKILSSPQEQPMYPVTVTRSAINFHGKINAEIPLSEIKKVSFEYYQGYDKNGIPINAWSYVLLETKEGKSYTLGHSLGSVPEIYVTFKKITETKG
jgi:hypothetical protein